MKRVTILAEEAVMVTPNGYTEWRIEVQGSERAFYFLGEVVESVEDVTDPLPTEPGATFWGRAEGVDAQWWFVRANGAGALFYAPTRTDVLSVGVHSHDVASFGLVRLPDPEVAP